MKPWLARSRAWISLLVLIPVGAVSVFSDAPFPIDSWTDFGFEALGCLLFVMGVSVRWWATVYIGGRKTDELVCDGPYSICRNPIYWGTFFLAMAVAVLLESFTLVISVGMVAVLYFRTTISVEEDRLLQRHGQAFVDYCERVPRLFPRFGTYRSPTIVNLRLDGVRAEFLRTLRYAWLPIACHLVTHLRTQNWWPDLNLLP